MDPKQGDPLVHGASLCFFSMIVVSMYMSIGMQWHGSGIELATSIKSCAHHITSHHITSRSRALGTQMIERLGREINNEDSVYYWAARNGIPVFCPALTDGSIGDMLYFHSFKCPGLILDIVADVRAMNDHAVHAAPRKTGMVILGGGLSTVRR